RVANVPLGRARWTRRQTMKRYSVPPAPRIEPLPLGTSRPLWSVMVPAYNYAEYMPATLHSVISQDPGAAEMQFDIVDDCSTAGDSEAVARDIGGGRIGFQRQPQNVGMIRN